MSDRKEFPAAVKWEAWKRCNGHCEHCGLKIVGARLPVNYDHVNPDYLGGANDLSNIQVLCKTCHGAKTSKEDRPKIDKSRRIRKKAAGIKRKSAFRKPAGYKYQWYRDWD